MIPIPKRKVILESPLAGTSRWLWVRFFQQRANEHYARLCMRDCIFRGESPMASHLLYPQALDDNIPEERGAGISCGLLWGIHADWTVVYVDRGVTRGMKLGIADAHSKKRPIVYRSLFDKIEKAWPYNPEDLQ